MEAELNLSGKKKDWQHIIIVYSKKKLSILPQQCVEMPSVSKVKLTFPKHRRDNTVTDKANETLYCWYAQGYTSSAPFALSHGRKGEN